ncbi:MAG: hypothetical protein D3908_13565, partial [Candidatus Electrothrix sp. AUS4]|nr:hypothetical protein [Candidatus Electrothrix sp. AUS4]
MKNNNFFIVDWDSSFFGFNIAKINRESIRQEELTVILTDLKKKKYRLVYLYVSEKILYSLAFFDETGSFFYFFICFSYIYTYDTKYHYNNTGEKP